MAHILLVVGLAFAAGAAVYLLSLRLLADEPTSAGTTSGSGFVSEAAPPAPGRTSPAADLPPGYGYVLLAPGRRSWQTRVLALAGLLVVVALAAAVFAVGLYQTGHLLNRLFAEYVNSTPSPSLSP